MVTLANITPTSTLEPMAVECAALFARQPPLDSAQWTRAMIALFAVVIVGFVLIASVLAWGRRMRRILKQDRKPSQMSRDAWYEKPLVREVDEPPENEPD